MSERGSFCTEYIYCDKCFAAAKNVLLDKTKQICSTTIPSWSEHEHELPIIAGKIGTDLAGCEDMVIKELAGRLSNMVCHSMRIAVLSENGTSTIVVVTPIPSSL